jgi:hypothetical protein
MRHPRESQAGAVAFLLVLGLLAGLSVLIERVAGLGEPAASPRASSELQSSPEADPAPTVGAGTPATAPPSAGSPSSSPSPPGPSESFDAPSDAADERFAVTVTEIKLRRMTNASLVGAERAPVNEKAARLAVEAASSALGRYLNAQFVEPATRFSAGPVEALLTADAAQRLSAEARQALGATGFDPARTTPGRVEAQAAVLVDGPEGFAVALDYVARLTATRSTAGASSPTAAGSAAGSRRAPVEIVQRGVVTLVPTQSGWQAISAELALDAPTGSGPGPSAEDTTGASTAVTPAANPSAAGRNR